MCDKKTTQKQNSTSTTKLSDWSKSQYEAGKTDINDTVAKFNAKPYVPYSGETVAGLSASEQRARQMADKFATDGATQVDGPDAVQYRTFADFDSEEYYNPFEKDVVDSVSKSIDDNLTKSINDNQLRATSSGAYGGSRHGVADAELMRTAGQDKAAKVAELRYAGFNDAADRFERDSGNLYTAGTRNSDADYSARRDNAVRHDAAAKEAIDMMASLGLGEREIEQARLLAEKAKYDDAYADEWKRFQVELQTKIGLFGSTPMMTDTTSTGTSTSKTSDPLGSIASITGGMGGLFTGLGGLFSPAAGAT